MSALGTSLKQSVIHKREPDMYAVILDGKVFGWFPEEKTAIEIAQHRIYQEGGLVNVCPVWHGMIDYGAPIFKRMCL